MWTEQNVLKVDMEVVVMFSSVLWEMLYIWYGEREGMCTVYRYENAFCGGMESAMYIC
jgi:hypothetical protein